MACKTADGKVSLGSLIVPVNLDAEALAALNSLPQDVSYQILEDASEARVRNPSAYVRAAVQKVKQQHHRPKKSGVAAESKNVWETLDSSAKMAIEGLPMNIIQDILNQVAHKGSSVRNPSAYVKAAAEKQQQLLRQVPPAMSAHRQPEPSRPALALTPDKVNSKRTPTLAPWAKLAGTPEQSPISASTAMGSEYDLESIADTDRTDATEQVEMLESQPKSCEPPRLASTQVELCIGDPVLARWGTEWHPAVVRRFLLTSDVHGTCDANIEVLWDAEWSISRVCASDVRPAEIVPPAPPIYPPPPPGPPVYEPHQLR